MENTTENLGISSQEAYLLSIMHSLWKNRCISVILGLRIPEMLSKQSSMRIDEISSKTGCQTSDKLYAVMKVLAQYGIGEEKEGKHFATNETMELLRRDNGPGLGHMFDYVCGDELYSSLRRLGSSVKSTESAFVLEHGMDHFTYMSNLGKSYEKAKIFQGTSDYPVGSIERRKEFAESYPSAQAYLTNLYTLPDKPGVKNVYNAYPWSGCKKIVDVGGSLGHFLASVLKQEGCEHIEGFVLELPEVVKGALRRIHELGPIGQKIKFIKHDIYQPLSRDLDVKADTVVLKNVLSMFINDHDSMTKILGNSRGLFSPEGGKLLIIDAMAPDTKYDRPAINGIEMEAHSIHWMNISQHNRLPTKTIWMEKLEVLCNELGYKMGEFYEAFRGGQVIFELLFTN